jgi:hypothetical protein
MARFYCHCIASKIPNIAHHKSLEVPNTNDNVEVHPSEELPDRAPDPKSSLLPEKKCKQRESIIE